MPSPPNQRVTSRVGHELLVFAAAARLLKAFGAVGPDTRQYGLPLFRQLGERVFLTLVAARIAGARLRVISIGTDRRAAPWIGWLVAVPFFKRLTWNRPCFRSN